jgi:hypothetical protein
MNHKKNIPTVLMAALLCIVGFICIIALVNKNSDGQAPIRRIRIIIDVDRRGELFTQLRKFAEKHDFRILIRDVDVTPDGIFIEMNRDDLDILAGDVPNSPTKIDLRFYEADSMKDVPEETIDLLFNDLVSLINEIPNITISNEN